MKQKTVPLPCTEDQFKIIKMYCLMNGLKYSDLTTVLVNLIKVMEKEGNKENDDKQLSNMVQI